MRFSLFLNHSALASSLNSHEHVFDAQPDISTPLQISMGRKSVLKVRLSNPHGILTLSHWRLDQPIGLTATRDADNSAVYSTTTVSSLLMTRSLTNGICLRKTVTIPPISDGRYTIKSEILDSKSTVVLTTSHPFIIDTVGLRLITSVPWIHWVQHGCNAASLGTWPRSRICHKSWIRISIIYLVLIRLLFK